MFGNLEEHKLFVKVNFAHVPTLKQACWNCSTANVHHLKSFIALVQSLATYEELADAGRLLGMTHLETCCIIALCVFVQLWNKKVWISYVELQIWHVQQRKAASFVMYPSWSRFLCGKGLCTWVEGCSFLPSLCGSLPTKKDFCKFSCGHCFCLAAKIARKSCKTSLMLLLRSRQSVESSLKVNL